MLSAGNASEHPRGLLVEFSLRHTTHRPRLLANYYFYYTGSLLDWTLHSALLLVPNRREQILKTDAEVASNREDPMSQHHNLYSQKGCLGCKPCEAGGANIGRSAVLWTIGI